MTNPILILDPEAIRRALRRIAHEIIEQNPDPSQLAIVGIPSRGAELARRLVSEIVEIQKIAPAWGVVDIAMHRDDLHLRPTPPRIHPTELPHNLNGSTVILVDDVLFTGRTIRAALDALSSFGRPACVRLAVLVDRGHRELPIRPDFVGKNLPTSRAERVMVRLENVDNQPDSVSLQKS